MGNSVFKEERTDSAALAEMSRMLIVAFWEAKYRTSAKPIPDAPPGGCKVRDVSCNSDWDGGRYTGYNYTLACESRTRVRDRTHFDRW